MDAAAEIGMVKEKDGLGVRDRGREKKVKARFLSEGKSLGLDPAFSEMLSEVLMSRAVDVQLKGESKDLRGKRALVVGGSGRMGAWLCRRLSNRGAAVEVWDPRRSLPGYRNVKDLERAVGSADIIVVSSPPGTCPDDLRSVLDLSPRGLVFDICSVKAHIGEQLRSATREGMKVTSVHPMFGPNVPSPRGRTVIVCDCGSRRANKEAETLFRDAGGKVFRSTLERHDQLMAYVLGLPHASILMFGSVVSGSSIGLRELVKAEGPSFERMLGAATEMSTESVRVYHDIQALNPATKKMFKELERALSAVEQASMAKDPAKFRQIMDSIGEHVEVS
jgi:chorismate mutase/prephenate dehydrogenase